MKNIDYLELFFKKHNLSGKVKVKYSSPIVDDDCMSYVVLENGDTISINDIIFDIESNFPNDVAEQWMIVKRENGISFPDWVQTNTNYVPSDMDTSSVESYHMEMEEILNDVNKTINAVFDAVRDDEVDNEENDGSEIT